METNQKEIILQRLVDSLVPREKLPQNKSAYLSFLKKSLEANYSSVSKNEGTISNILRQKLEESSRKSKIDLFDRLLTRFKATKILKHTWKHLSFLLSTAKLDKEGTSIKHDTFSTLYLNPPKEESVQQPQNPVKQVSSRPEILKIQDGSTITRNELIDDLIYAIQGIEGKFITLDEEGTRLKIKLDQRTTSIVREVGELGWLYKKIVANEKVISSHSRESLVLQAFLKVLHTEIGSYFKLLANLRSMNSSNSSTFTLKTLFLYTQEAKTTLTWLATITDSLLGLKGTNAISQIFSYSAYFGSSKLTDNLFVGISFPFLSFTTQWLIYGESIDKFNEFFIEVKENLAQDQIWTERYKMKAVNLPTFIEMPLLNNIFEIGKIVNFLKHFCGENSISLLRIQDLFIKKIEERSRFFNLSTDEMDLFVKSVDKIEKLTKSESKVWDLILLSPEIELVKQTTSLYLLEVISEKYRFVDHLTAIFKYLLLSQGDMVQYLMSLLIKELSKQAVYIYKHNLINILDTSIKASNAQFHDPEIIKNLEIVLFEGKRGETGWDVFMLDYKVSPPLTAVFTKKCMTSYKKIFNFFFALKRLEYSQNKDIWHQMMKLSHQYRSKFSEVRPFFQRSLLMNQQITHFISNLHSYISLEVLESEWFALKSQLENCKSLSELAEMHERFVSNVRDRSLLAEKQANLFSRLQTIFSLVSKFNTRHVHC